MIQFEYHVSSLKAPTGDNSNVSPPSFWDFKFVEKIPHLAYTYIHPRKFNIAPGLTARQKKKKCFVQTIQLPFGFQKGRVAQEIRHQAMAEGDAERQRVRMAKTQVVAL